MIITVTLNAAVDKTLAVPNFRIGRRHRAVEQTSMAGGKGVNVARALKTLGQPVIATGVAGGPTGTRIIQQLTDEAILNDFVRIRDESRTSTAVVDDTTGEQTEINEHGPAVSEAEIELFRDKLLYLAKGAAVCVFAGSLPGGVADSFYAEMIVELNQMGVTTVLDAVSLPEASARVASTVTRTVADWADLVITNQSHALWLAAFRQTGFAAARSNYLLAMSKPLVEAVGGAADRVHVSRGDGDGRIHLL